MTTLLIATLIFTCTLLGAASTIHFLDQQLAGAYQQTQHGQYISIMKTLVELIALVEASNTAQDSLIILTGGIKARLDEVLAGALTPDQQAKVDAIFASLEAQKAEIVAAIAANTTPATPNQAQRWRDREASILTRNVIAPFSAAHG